MNYELTIEQNAIDSLEEALACFKSGQGGKVKSYKFAILHMSHFLELTLKMYVATLEENLIFSKCFRYAEKLADSDKTNILEAIEKLKNNKFEFQSLIKSEPNPHTITLDQAMKLAKCEKCSRTGVDFVGTDFSDDVNWIKGLRNNIEHYQFSLAPKEVRLTIGRLVRSSVEFVDIFGLFNLEEKIGKESLDIFNGLADEYIQSLTEAKLEVAEQEAEAFRGVRPKHYAFIEWNVYSCPECSNPTLIPNKDSSSGYRCTFCKNEESGEIEVSCDSCGASAPSEEMKAWRLDDDVIEYRCDYCTGQYQADRSD
nr:hypothetical protein [uncultured Albidiferax sp.]